jgi:hypothetical protein
VIAGSGLGLKVLRCHTTSSPTLTRRSLGMSPTTGRFSWGWGCSCNASVECAFAIAKWDTTTSEVALTHSVTVVHSLVLCMGVCVGGVALGLQHVAGCHLHMQRRPAMGHHGLR